MFFLANWSRTQRKISEWIFVFVPKQFSHFDTTMLLNDWNDIIIIYLFIIIIKDYLYEIQQLFS